MGKPAKKSIELQASRIRREPPPAAKPSLAKTYFDPAEWESWTVVTGVVLFAVALAIIVVGFSNYLI